MPAPDARANPHLFGHDETAVLTALAGARLHHAWLITGPEGVGKATFAYRFARRLLGGAAAAADPAHPVFRRVAAAAHADLLVVERGLNERTKRQRTQITAEEARRVGAFLSLTPAEGGWRVVIVDGAEDLNATAANALLKILEEPPPRAILLLTCSAPGRLPVTIRSRCRRLRLSALDDAAMTEALATYRPDLTEAQRLRLIGLAEGSIGRALELGEGEGLAIGALVDRLLAALPDPPPERAREIADTLSRSDTGFVTFMDVLIQAIAAATRDAVRGQADEQQARFLGDRSLDDWGALWQGLRQLRDETERLALDKRQAIQHTLAALSGRTR
jgi:DNA polymerase-3 subunit delta'